MDDRIERDDSVDFGAFTQKLNKYFNNAGNRQDFMAFLMHAIMSGPITDEEKHLETQDEFYPFATKKSKSSAYKAYSGKQFPVDVAERAVTHFRPDELKGFINQLDTKDLLAKDMTSIGLPCIKQNVADKICDYIYTYLDSVANGRNVSVAIVSASTAISLNPVNTEYISELLNETGNKCPKCGSFLYVKANGRTQPFYEVVRIYDGDGDDYDNLIVLCPACKAKYSLATDENRDELFTLKMDLASILRVNEMMASWDVVDGIEKVIKAIPNIPSENLIDLRYDPVAVKEKIDTKAHFALYRKVASYVSVYYPDVESIFQAQVRENNFKYESFCYQVKSRYLAFYDEGLEPEKIFDSLVQWLMDSTHGDRTYCEIVISFFVQKCEVFG